MIQLLVNPKKVKMVSEPSLLGRVFTVRDNQGEQVARFAVEAAWPMVRFMLKVGDEVASVYLEATEVGDKARDAVDQLLANYNMVLEE